MYQNRSLRPIGLQINSLIEALNILRDNPDNKEATKYVLGEKGFGDFSEAIKKMIVREVKTFSKINDKIKKAVADYEASSKK